MLFVLYTVLPIIMEFVADFQLTSDWLKRRRLERERKLTRMQYVARF